MRTKILTFCLAMGLSAGLFAQNLPSKVSVFLPKQLLENKVLSEATAYRVLGDASYGQNVIPSVKKFWVVFSDRSNNRTYTAPDGMEVKDILKFNEQVRIAKIVGNYALVYTEPNTMTTYPKVSEDAVCRGWVPMNNLLLWDVCMANDRGIYYKALLCINADERTTNYGMGYLNPTDPSTKFPLTTDMKFYFVMKRTNDGKVLLATQHNMNDGASNQVLYAWVPKESYVPWNQRSCIEPTWEHEDVEYFAGRGIQAKIYETRDLSGQVASTVPFRKKEGYDQYMYRMSPSALRFPILDRTDATRYECSSFTSTAGSVDVSQTEDPLLEKKKEQMKKLQTINLAIVIDGTKSMDPYFPAVLKAIKDGCAFFDNNKYKVNVGVLIYRDYADGEGLVEQIPFRKPSSPDLAAFLASGGKYGIKSSVADKSYTEALFYGINSALDNFRFDPEQSSLMLVVGDCGNAEDDTKAPTMATIIKKLVDKNVNLVGYQVRNTNADAWNLFNRQLIQLMKMSLQIKYDNVKKGSKVRGKVTNDGQVFINDRTNNSLFLGNHRYATAGTEISPDVLANLMKNTIKDYSALVQGQIDAIIKADQSSIASVQKQGAQSSFAGSEATLEATTVQMNQAWLEKRLGSAYKKNANQLVSFRGWTLKKDASEREFFKPVLFISSEEFDELMSRLKPVDDVARVSSSDYRKPYVDAIKALLKSMAPGLSNAEMDQKGIAEVMNMIEGLNASSAAMSQKKGRTLLEISDEMAVRAPEYRRLVNDFSQKYQNLSYIKDGHYKYVRDFNGAKYYWIPIEDLP